LIEEVKRDTPGLAACERETKRATSWAAQCPVPQYTAKRPIKSPRLLAPTCTSLEHKNSANPTPSKSHSR
jgi:hypothetical protein